MRSFDADSVTGRQLFPLHRRISAWPATNKPGSIVTFDLCFCWLIRPEQNACRGLFLSLPLLLTLLSLFPFCNTTAATNKYFHNSCLFQAKVSVGTLLVKSNWHISFCQAIFLIKNTLDLLMPFLVSSIKHFLTLFASGLLHVNCFVWISIV